MNKYEIYLLKRGLFSSNGWAVVEAESDEKALEKAKRLYPGYDEYIVDNSSR